MRRNPAVWVGLLAALLLGAGQAAWRGGEEPRPEELVPWEPHEALGEPPWDRKVLLDFSADWCGPCRVMQRTTFRDSGFAAGLEERGLRPVRIEETSENWRKFQDLRARYRVAALPSLVLLREDGKPAPPIVGLKKVDTLLWELDRRGKGLDTELRWHPPGYAGSGTPDRITVLTFGYSYLLHRSDRDDWTRFPSEEFQLWADRHVDFVSDPSHPVRGRIYYDRWGIRSVPSIVVLGPGGELIARFEGAREIAGAPAEIARRARERGIDISDPPVPYSEAGAPAP